MNRPPLLPVCGEIHARAQSDPTRTTARPESTKVAAQFGPMTSKEEMFLVILAGDAYLTPDGLCELSGMRIANFMGLIRRETQRCRISTTFPADGLHKEPNLSSTLWVM